jgi:hypothetical protein
MDQPNTIPERHSSASVLATLPTTDEMSEEQKKKKQARLNKPLYTSKLAAYIRKNFDVAKSSRTSASNGKLSIDTRLIESRRQVECIYDPDTLHAIEEFGGTKEYDPMTIQKCLVAESWIKDIMSPADDKPWTIEPSPIPDLPEEVQTEIERAALQFYEEEIPDEIKEDESDEAGALIAQEVEEKSAEMRDTELKLAQDEAKLRAERMEKIIYDQLVDGDFMNAFDDFLQYLCRSLVGIIKGPVYKKKKSLAYINMDQNWGVDIKDKEQQYYYAPDPQNVYFSPNCRHQDTGDVFEIMPFQSSSVQDLIGVEGYNEEAIREVIRDHRSGGLREWTNNRWETDSLEDRPQSETAEYNSQIDAVDYWGKVPGQYLRDWGMSKEDVSDDDLFYDIHAILIGRHVILSELNPDKLGRRPYHVTSFEKQSGSIYGRGIPEKIRPAQKAANMVRRALINNVALSSGPQVVVNTDALPQGEDLTSMHPWKIWQTKYIQGVAQKPVDFIDVPSRSDELSSLLEKFYNDADRDTGIPRYVQGDQNAALRGAAGTAALRDSERVITPVGPVPIAELEIGDEVSNTYGGVSKVTGVYPQGMRGVYRVKFSNGTTVDCDLEHRWSVQDHIGRPFKTLRLEEILEKGLYRSQPISKKNRKGIKAKWFLPNITKPVKYEDKEVPIDPYTVGAIIGDGDGRGRLTQKEMEIFDYIPYEKGKPEKRNGSYQIQIKGIRAKLRELGLDCGSPETFIPMVYLENSEKIRRELLKGLMDTDGCITKSGKCFYTTTSLKLAEDFIKLVKSLGGHTNGICTASDKPRKDYPFPNDRKHNTKQGYRVIFNLDEDIVKLSRKKERTCNIPKREKHIYITGVEYIDDDTVTCITVDAKDSCFICENYIITHNSGLSMLMNAASKSMKRVLMNIDTDIFKRVIQYQYDLNMRDPNVEQDAKGDFNVQVKGSLALAVKEQLQQARAEFMQTVLSNETLFNIVGKKGIISLLREITKGLDMPTHSIIPTDQTIESQEQQGAMQQLQMLIEAGVQNGIIDEQQAQLLMDPEAVQSDLDQPPAPMQIQPQAM